MVHRETDLKSPPSRPGHFLWGVLPEFKHDPLGLFMRTVREQGDVATLRFGPYTNYLISHPDGIQHVLQINQRNYQFDSFGNDIMRLATGENLLTSNGAEWRHRRRLMQPVFHRRRIETFGDVMVDTVLKLLESWQSAASSGQPIDLCEEMKRLAFWIAGKTLLSIDLYEHTQELAKIAKVLLNYAEYRMNTMWYVPLLFPTRRNRTFKKARAQLHRIMQATLDKRRQKNLSHNDPNNTLTDMMSMLLAARDEETGTGLTETQVRDELSAMIGAGAESIAIALPWTFYLLSQHPDVEQTVRTELESVLGDSPPGIGDLPKLPYLKMVFEESLRLYPLVWTLAVRQSVEEDEICGYHIPAKASLLIVPYTVHHDSRFWEDPEQFQPERFASDQAAHYHKFSYLAFGGGPRKCIGFHFGMIEGLLILATILQRTQLHPKPGYQAIPDPAFTLRIKDGLPMYVSFKEP